MGRRDVFRLASPGTDESLKVLPRYRNLVNEQQQLLMAKYATMEANLNALKSQSTALAGELAQLDANSGTSSNSGSSSGG